MALERREPYRNFNFRVTIGGRSGGADGFSEVRFPIMTAGTELPESTIGERHLVLRRGYTGAPDLREWWAQERTTPKRGKGRVVVVELLDETAAGVVTTWRFAGCRPTTLHYSPLNALESGIVIETVELAYDDVEIT